MLSHRCNQMSAGCCLQSQIDAENKILSVVYGFHTVNIFYDPPPCISKYTFFPVHAGEMTIKCVLDSFLSTIIDIGKTQYMAGIRTGGVIAVIFPLRVDPRQIKSQNNARSRGRKVPAKIDKLFPSVTLEKFLDLARRQAQRFGQWCQICIACGQDSGVSPNRIHWRTNGKNLATAIKNTAPDGFDGERSELASSPLCLQATVIKDLQL
jgi:hypothetical protein